MTEIPYRRSGHAKYEVGAQCTPHSKSNVPMILYRSKQFLVVLIISITLCFERLDCLRSFTDTEELADSERYTCGHCKMRQRSTKKFWIKRLPNVCYQNKSEDHCIFNLFVHCNLLAIYNYKYVRLERRLHEIKHLRGSLSHKNNSESQM